VVGGIVVSFFAMLGDGLNPRISSNPKERTHLDYE